MNDIQAAFLQGVLLASGCWALVSFVLWRARYEVGWWDGRYAAKPTPTAAEGEV